MNLFKLVKTSYTYHTKAANAVANQYHATRQLGHVVFDSSASSQEKNVLVFRKTKQLWLCVATENGNVVSYNLFNKKIIQQIESLNAMYEFVCNNSLIIDKGMIIAGVNENKERELERLKDKPLFSNMPESKCSPAYYAEIGTYEAGDTMICELCGATFSTTDENRDCCYDCQS